MKPYLKRTAYLFFLVCLISCKSHVNNVNTIVELKTSLGDIKLKLYDGTPLHRDNFVTLVNSGFYDGISFHRVIKDFMVQAGDPATKGASAKNLPDSLNTYTIPPEFNVQYLHKKGALAAARQGDDVNPGKRSSGTQFYIVQGVKFTDDDLNKAEQKINGNVKQGKFNIFLKATADSIKQAGKSMTDAQIQELASIDMFNFLSSYKDFKFSEEQRNTYKTIGGTPRLDGSYTVFGEVTEGLNVIDKIASVQTDSTDKPVNDVKIIKAKIVKN